MKMCSLGSIDPLNREAFGSGVRHSGHLLPTPLPWTPAAVEKINSGSSQAAKCLLSSSCGYLILTTVHLRYWSLHYNCKVCESCHEKLSLQSFRPGPTQTEQYSLPQKMARGLKFGFRNERDSTIYVMKTKV